MAKETRTVPCRVCKQPFPRPAYESKRVCDECVERRAKQKLDAALRKWGPRPCAECGKEFTPTNHQNTKYCGTTCRKASTLRMNRAREKSKHQKVAPRVCEICKSEFEPIGSASTCSRECRKLQVRRMQAHALQERAELQDRLLAVQQVSLYVQLRVTLKLWHQNQRGICVRLWGWDEKLHTWTPNPECLVLPGVDAPHKLRVALSAALEGIRLDDEAAGATDDEESETAAETPAHV